MSRSSWQLRFGHTPGTLVLCLAFIARVAICLPVSGAETKPLLFLGDKDYPPLTYLDNQQPAGMAVDVAKALAGPMNRKIHIELMDWNLAQQKVLNGEADALLEISSTPERQKLYDFANSTFAHEFGFVVRSGTIFVRTVDDLKGKTIGVTAGGFPRKFLETRSDLKLVFIDDYKQGFNRVAAGTLDAVAVDLWVAEYLIEKGGVTGVSLVEKPFATAHAAIAVKKGNTALAQEIAHGMEALRAQGTLAKIENNWRPQQVVFASRQKIKDIIALITSLFLAIFLTALLLWVLTLKKQIHLRKNTEAALRANEQHLRNLTRAAFEGIAISENGRFLDANDQMVAMFGYDRKEEILGTLITDLVAPESRETVADAIRSGRETLYEHRLLRKDGSSFFAEARAQVVREGDRMLRLTAVRDITKRKLSEELNKTQSEVLEMITRGEPLLQTLDALLHMIEAQSPEMLCSILLLDPDGIHLRHGAAPSLPAAYMESIDGKAIGPCAGSCGTAAYRREAVFASDIATDPLWVDYRQFALPHGLLACWSTPILDAQRNVLGTFAIYYRTKGLPNERHLRLISTATHTAAVCITKNCTDAALHESEERFRALVEFSPDCIAVAVDEKLVYVNPTGLRLIGAKSVEEIIGREAFDFVPPELHEAVRERRKIVREEGISSPVIEFPLLRLDRSRVMVESKAVPFVYAGKPAILNLIRDVTERNRAETERLDAASREKKAREEFTHLLIASQEAERKRIAGELHDGLGQNLSIIKNRAHLAGLETVAPPVAAEHLIAIERVVTDAIAEARNLAHNLRPAHIEQVGLTASLQELIREVSQSTQIRFERRVENVDDFFNPDGATNVYRIVQEALNNLVKHSHAEQATITIERDIHAVHLRIADDGVGFDIGEAATRRGLGLTSMTERVRMLRGELHIQSSPGNGTQLTIELPAAENGEVEHLEI